jgi:hypothetical protein
MSRSQAGEIVFGSDAIQVTLDPATGAVTQVRNLLRHIDLVGLPPGQVPWRVEIMNEDGSSTWIQEFSQFVQERMDDVMLLRWTTDDGLSVSATISAPEGGDSVSFEVAAHAPSGMVIDKIEYPILTGIRSLHNEADSLLAHSQGTGFLFRNPYDLFEQGGERARQGLRYSPYPEGFNGSTMQFFTYYAEGIGGFMADTPDPDGGMKWFNTYKGSSGALNFTFMHQMPDMRPGADFHVPYPVVISATTEGTWYEAADRYKAWATEQAWTSRGTLAERNDRASWLLDDVGFATFGINAAHDRAGWLDRFHKITGEPVFHILGVNWPKEPTGYGRGHPGGRDDWFPATFSEENLATIRENGDYWAPFEFDLLLDPGKAEHEQVVANRMQLPEEKYSFDRYHFFFQCPATDYLPALHAWRDAELAGTYGADALYYDISANNVLMACRNPDHGHPVGGGGWMIDAFARMWENTGKAASAAKGELVPQGAEMVSEQFIPYLAYYQARAEASPLSAFEADFFRDWIRSGQVEKIPLFTYVYHEYGPVRLDGWGKLSVEVGDLWYWVASRVALWGGLFELNYEFSDLEALEGFFDDPGHHYADFESRAYQVDPNKVTFVREVALARTGFARDWLVYGTMLRPLAIDARKVSLDYHLYNLGQRLAHYDEKGTLEVPSVIHAAWRAPDGRIGFAFVNLLGNEEQTLSLEIDPGSYGGSKTPCTLRQLTGDSQMDLGSVTGPVVLQVVLSPRRITIIEMTPSPD